VFCPGLSNETTVISATIASHAVSMLIGMIDIQETPAASAAVRELDVLCLKKLCEEIGIAHAYINDEPTNN
jgi:hypothetical protein